MEREFEISGGELGGRKFSAVFDENNECVITDEGKLYKFRIVDDQAVYCGEVLTAGSLDVVPESELYQGDEKQ